jgi:hypothetical protein
MAKSMREGEAKAAASAAGDAAGAAADAAVNGMMGRVGPALDELMDEMRTRQAREAAVAEVETKKAANVPVPDEMNSMMKSMMKPIIQQIMGGVMSQFGIKMPEDVAAGAAPDGWTRTKIK